MAKKNRIADVCLIAAAAFLLLWASGIAALAAAPDLSRKCTVSIKMEYSGEVVPGGNLCMYRIAQWTFRDDDSYGFTYVPELEDCGLELKDKHTELYARRMSMLIESRSLPSETHPIGADGRVKFTDLECGLYVVYQTLRAPGFEQINAFCLSLPMVEDGECLYDVEASPKPRPEKTTEHSEPPEPSDPTKPGETTTDYPPTVPGYTRPTTPGGTNPTSPGGTNPTSPGVTRPTSPGETRPTTPAEEVTTAPAQEPTTAPGEPEELPQTGQVWWPVWPLGVCGLLSFGFGLALRILFRYVAEGMDR